MWGTSCMFWVIEARSSSIGVSTKVINVEALFNANHVGCTVSNVVVKWTAICISTYRTTPIWKFTPCIWLVGFVKSVCMVISSLLTTSANSCVVATRCVVVMVMMPDMTSCRSWRRHRCEVANVKGSCASSSYSTSHVAMNWLLASVVSTSVVEPSLVELICSYLTECVLILSCSNTKVAAVALMNWVTSSTRGSLLSELCFSNSFWNWIAVWMVSTGACRSWEHHIVAARIKKLCGHHHLLLLLLVARIVVWGLSLVY